ncbi:helix-turn-helix domain-containing protein [Streptomyces sp. NBC_00582]|uniref:helix-turn-helix domain-containing protein n=1 Tax=Streptomyces sp. NBC_00582 TaxID=2975783 RepID=UPI002E813943|nr:helix-turn-helix domain-containing protein [Streptomyces sp. NBC_00582]WUB60444.1 helix-turn-helix domain-containing protein [Streptomyces sp. NBC_00582]
MVEKINYSIDEAVEASGLGRSTIFELIKSGDLPSFKEGRRRLIPADAIRAHSARRLAEQNGQAA